jgi:hypothetical protein
VEGWYEEPSPLGTLICASVVQLVRTVDPKSICCGFESCRMHYDTMYEKPLKHQVFFAYFKQNLLFTIIEIALFLVAAVVLCSAGIHAVFKINTQVYGVILLGGGLIFFITSCYFVSGAWYFHKLLKNWNKYDT